MNATVTLPIGDLDKLRNDLKEAEEKVKFFEKHEKSVKLIVTEHLQVNQLMHYRYGAPYYEMVDKFLAKEPQYINFEDVKAQLKKEAENTVIEKIGQLDRLVVDLKTSLQNKETYCKKEFEKIRKENSDKIEKLEKEHFEQIEKIQNEHEEQRTKLGKEISILKGEDVDTEQEKLIKKLTNQVNELKNRSFLERLLNL
jgi:flagellar biosynthesis/type III secretory pathway protein FliH